MEMGWEDIAMQFLPETVPLWVGGVVVALALFGWVFRKLRNPKPCWVKRRKCCSCKKPGTFYQGHNDTCVECGGEISLVTYAYWWNGEKLLTREERREQLSELKQTK